MSNVLVIQSAFPSDSTGANANVILSGTPNGSVSFMISRTPYYAQAWATTFTGAGPYLVALPHPDTWFIWVLDTDGVCAQPGASYYDEWTQLGAHIQQVLIDAVPALNAALQTWIPGITIGSIIYGPGQDTDLYPAVIISHPEVDPDWVGEPYLTTYAYKCMLTCILLHEDEISYQQACTALLQCIGGILRNPFNESFVLPNGHGINFAQARGLQVSDREIGGHWVTTGSLIWSALGQRLDTGNQT